MKNQHEKDAEKKRIHRANEIPEESKKRREVEVQRANINRANETPEKANDRKERNAKRTKLNRLNASPERAKERREKHAETVRKFRLKKKASQQEARNERLKRQVLRSTYKSPNPDQGEDAEEVPNISQYVETRESIISAYEHLMKTELKENEKIEIVQMRPGVDFPLAGMCHQANVCVCCDRFIIGTSEIKWINKTVLLFNEKRLQCFGPWTPTLLIVTKSKG